MATWPRCSSRSSSKPSNATQILAAWKEFRGRPQELGLPSAPAPFLHYFEDDTRPQTRLDRDAGNGQAISIGRLRPDAMFDWRFVALSHNTVRGAAGGAVLTAELLKHEGYLAAEVISTWPGSGHSEVSRLLRELL